MSGRISRRNLFRAAGALGAGAAVASGGPSDTGADPALQAPAGAGIEPNTLRRRGVGFRGHNPDRAARGYTLFAPLAAGKTVHLIDQLGSEVNTWQMPYPPGLYGYLTDRGTLFYGGKIPNDSFIGRSPFRGGAALEADWDGNVLWEIQKSDHHHDARLLKNGNVLLICAAELPADIASKVRGGIPGSEPDGKMYADYLVEMTTAGETVWEWRAWEHLDPEQDEITMPSDSRAEWTHANGVIELPDGNILLSMRNISTLLRINRRSGEIEWKLGPPPLSGQHGPVALPNGNVLIFDNGPYRVDQGAPQAPYSRVLEIDPTTNEIVWKYQEASEAPGIRGSFFSALISNAQRLPNGNTFINEGLSGRFFEVTMGGDVVWEYVNPYFGPPTGEPRAQQNQVFRAYRYTEDEIARAQATV